MYEVESGQDLLTKNWIDFVGFPDVGAYLDDYLEFVGVKSRVNDRSRGRRLGGLG